MKLLAVCCVTLILTIHFVPESNAQQYSFGGNIPRLGKRGKERTFAGVPKLGKRMSPSSSNEMDEEMAVEQYLKNFLLKNPELAKNLIEEDLQRHERSVNNKQSQ